MSSAQKAVLFCGGFSETLDISIIFFNWFNTSRKLIKIWLFLYLEVGPEPTIMINCSKEFIYNGTGGPRYPQFCYLRFLLFTSNLFRT